MCVSVCTHVRAVEARRNSQVVLLRNCPSSLDRVFYGSTTHQITRLGGHQIPGTNLPLPPGRMHQHTPFRKSPWERNSGPPACKASTFLTELSPQPIVIYFSKGDFAANTLTPTLSGAPNKRKQANTDSGIHLCYPCPRGKCVY